MTVESIAMLANFPNYGVTPDGQVYNFRVGTFMSLKRAGKWKAVVISHRGAKALVYVHDLIAEAFLPPRPETAKSYFDPAGSLVEPENMDVPWLLSYKDGDYDNVTVENLEWRLLGACRLQVRNVMRYKKARVSDVLRRKVISGFPLYDIDTDGNVFKQGANGLVALRPAIEASRSRNENYGPKIVIPRQYVMLHPTLDGEGLKPVKCYVHELLGKAFMKTLLPSEVYWFQDGDPLRCYLDNLWVISADLFMEIYEKVWVVGSHNWTLERGFEEKDASVGI